MLTQLFHLHALSALHIGTGQALGAVDLPIARARASHLPLVPGSALKGVLRDELAGTDHEFTLFGPKKIETGGDGHAGALAFGDAHLLLLPVRSLAGVVAFATCPFVLARYAEDLKRAGAQGVPSVPGVASEQVQLAQASVLMAAAGLVALEDLDLTVAGNGAAEDWAARIASQVHPTDDCWQKRLKERIAIVSDDTFSFLADTATEIRARISLNDAGTVKEGPWYEENLPAETVLWGLVAAGPGREKGKAMRPEVVLKDFNEAVNDAGKREKLIQLGGKATVGRGLARFLTGGA
ncbi:MAG: type III-B CRISPR module RAMP protein Cmr4 [Pseudomonadota bacterium]|nr:type III-B CRISPR module RAMP protein Cmr4 [Pseudomonadota bacterium]